MPEQSGTAGPDLGAIFDLHMAAEFETEDLDATMATMTGAPHVTHVTHVPISHVSRTVGAARVVDEMVMHFTHDHVMDTFQPGVAPTCRPVALPVVVVADFEGDRVDSEHIYWDQASLLVQIGLLDQSILPVCGDEQAAKVLDESRPCNQLIARPAAVAIRPAPPPRTCRRRTGAPPRGSR